MGRQQTLHRREFLKGLGGSLLLGSTASLIPQLALMPRAAAQSGAGGYRALVCIYLAGANDSFNWLVPRDGTASGSHYNRYLATRGGVYSAANSSGLGLAFEDLLPVQPQASAAFGLHPSSTDFTAQAGGASQQHLGLQSLFNQSHAAFVCNVGPLLQPINKTQYNSGAPRPAQLFSHNDQENLWHLGLANKSLPQARYGWGGRVAKSTAGGALANGLSPAISIAGSARFLIGDQIMPYQVSSQGINLIDQYASDPAAANFQAARRAVLDDLLADSLDHPFARGYGEVMRRSIQVGEALTGLLAGPEGNLSTVFPANNNLAAQMQMVARMIKISRSLGATRQVYYVRHGSFDLHQNMFAAGQPVASSAHGALLTVVNQAIGAFWTALGEIGARDQVAGFTMSDFGRTLSGNGSGSDHAWGGHQLVFGGSVNGNRLYGRYPDMALNADDNASQDWSFNRGQYIPTLAVEQMAATLARWMGVSDGAALDAMFPLLGNFQGSDLGFMA